MQTAARDRHTCHDPNIREDGLAPLDGVIMAWIILFLAGILEIGWAIGLKYTEGFTKLLPTVLTGASMVASVVLLGIAVRTLPLGTAYAVWTGIGTVGTVILGIVLFAEPATAVRIGCIALIIAGIAGLKLTA
jgi:quaternary ammonium compound-resistance protein SugE